MGKGRRTQQRKQNDQENRTKSRSVTESIEDLKSEYNGWEEEFLSQKDKMKETLNAEIKLLKNLIDTEFSAAAFSISKSVEDLDLTLRKFNLHDAWLEFSDVLIAGMLLNRLNK